MANTHRPTLRLVQLDTVHKQGYALPNAWEAAVGGWLQWLRLRGLSEATIRLRRDHIRSIARRSKTACPGELNRGHLQMLVINNRWSNEHRKALRTSLHSFYEWCISAELANDNVAECLPKVKPPIPAPRPAPDHVWAELLARAAPRERVMALLAGEAGLRRAEISLVHTDDLLEDMAGWSLLVHGKGGRQRIVPLTHSLAAEIRAFCNGRRGFVFVGQIDGHLSAQYIGILLSQLMPEGWSAHKLRHRFATRGYAGTGNLRAVQEALGHASVATTQRYTAITSREVRSVSEAARSQNNDGVA